MADPIHGGGYILRLLGLGVLLILAVAVGGHAESLSHDMTSLNYYPHHRHFEIAPQFNATTRQEQFSSNGSASYKRNEQLVLDARYGLGNGVRLAIADTLTVGQSNRNVSAKGVETDSTSTGPNNPTLSLAWRVFESHGDGLSGDLGAAYSFFAGDHTTDDGISAHIGNQVSGGWDYSLSANLFWRWGINELGIKETFTRNSKSRTDGPGPASSFNTEAYSTLTPVITERLHLSPDVYAQYSVTINPAGTIQNDYDNGVVKTSHPPAYTSNRLSLGFRLRPFTVLEIMGNWSRDSVRTTTSNGTDVSNRNQTVMLGLIFRHQI